MVNFHCVYWVKKDIEWTNGMSESYIMRSIDTNRLTDPLSVVEIEQKNRLTRMIIPLPYLSSLPQ